MKKDITRDYTTDAFRLYAAMGEPTYEDARAAIYNAELDERQYLDPATAVVQAEAAVKKQTAFLLDIMAVSKTVELLQQDKPHIVRAVQAVYFVEPIKPLHKGDISARVRHFASQCPTDERTVYRWLKEARLLCAAIRGLRIEDKKRR